jgi:type I restriction enzyme S subunit
MIGKYPLMSIAELEAKGAILAIQDGNHGEKHPTVADYVSHGIPFVMANDLNDNFLDLVNCHFITEDTARRLRIGFSKTGDVLLTHKGTLGNVVLVKDVEPFIMLTPQVTYYRTDNTQLLNRFLVYAFREPSFQARMRSIADQGTRPYIGIRAQRELRIVCPEPLLQRRIAEILANYDDLIENNRRRMALLEESTRQLYREWFVCLRFPGFDHTHIVDGIPVGWQKITLKEITTKIGSGFTPRGGESSYLSEGTPLIRSLNVYDDIFEEKNLAFLDEDQAAALAGVAVISKDILLNITGASVARCCMAPDRYLPARVNQHVMIIRVDEEKADPFFVHKAINSEERKRQLLSYAQKGATREALTKEMVARFDVTLPTTTLMQQFGEIAAQSFRQREILAQQNQKLRAARDLLLPRLMSGEIAV